MLGGWPTKPWLLPKDGTDRCAEKDPRSDQERDAITAKLQERQ